MLNICYVISDVDKSFTLEWMFKNLDRKKLSISCIILRDERNELQEFLERKDIPVLRLRPGKSNLFRNILSSIRFMRERKTQAVHCHLFEGSIVGLIAAYALRIQTRIHTRHNATIHHDYHPHAVKYDRFINYLSTKIVSISDQVTKILVELEQVDPAKIIKIHHGFDFERMNDLAKQHFLEVKDKYHFDNTHFNVGVISRYMHFKGIQYIIPAFEKALQHIPNARLILANAYGPYGNEVKDLLKPLPKDSYMEINFEQNVYSLIKNFDVFVHVPIDINTEAFGQVYIENMALGVPGIFTKSGIAYEIVQNEKNAITVPFKNSDEITKAIIKLHDDEQLRKTLAQNAIQTVQEDFKIDVMIKNLESIYGV